MLSAKLRLKVFPKVDLASVTINHTTALLTFIPALLLTSLIRYLSVRTNDYSDKEPTMMNLPCNSVRYVSCLLETVWAGMVSVLVGLYAGGTAAKSIWGP